jgi:hypothetical protein
MYNTGCTLYKVRSETLLLISNGALAITYCFIDYSFQAQIQ